MKQLTKILKEINIIGWDDKESSYGDPHSVDMWYDKSSRQWIITVRDKNNNQIGNAEFEPNKSFALKTKKDLEFKYKLKEEFLYDREDMPQVEDIPEAVKAMKELGIEIVRERITPSSMKPSQTTLDMEKVESIAKDISIKSMKPIVISLDNHIVDGHHRWAGLKEAGLGNKKVPVYRIKLNRRMAIKAYNEVA